MYIYIYIYIYVGGLEHFLFFHNIWDNPFHWLIFFKMAKTTNQYRYDLIWYIVWYFLIVREFRETNGLNDQCTRSIYDIPATTSQNRAPWDFLFIRPLPEGQWQHLADVDRLGSILPMLIDLVQVLIDLFIQASKEASATRWELQSFQSCCHPFTLNQIRWEHFGALDSPYLAKHWFIWFDRCLVWKAVQGQFHWRGD